MKVEQIYTGCLAQGAYYISSEGEAAIIDPLREVNPYLQRAEREGAQIKYVFETHFHADFVSGHLDLAQKTGAKIIYGPTATPGFEAHIATDGEEFTLGKVRIKALHTPGHTLESTCYLLLDEEGNPSALFTGDTLFIGDVGRPDLAQKVVADLSQEKLAGMLYDSLHSKIMPLPDAILIYPAHGAGSACGKNMSKETSDSLGQQKRSNYALQPMSKEDFIREVTNGLLPPPIYFPENVKMNIKGYESLDAVMERGMRALDAEAFEAAANASGALILDTRKPSEFAQGFIPNAINIGIDGSFAPWVGALIPDIRQEILLVTEPGREEEVITRLARVGYDRTIGYLAGGMDAWEGKEKDQITSIAPEAFAEVEEATVLDVRKPGEYEAGHLTNARNVPLDFINDQIHSLDKNETYHIHCAGGYRSMIFASILKARGFEKVIDVQGGYKAIIETGAFSI
jgi:hydroxyacylglutathione hydrolase